jgi:hypothetical protein
MIMGKKQMICKQGKMYIIFSALFHTNICKTKIIKLGLVVTPVIPVLRRLKQKDHKFKVSETLSQKTKRKDNKSN